MGHGMFMAHIMSTTGIDNLPSPSLTSLWPYHSTLHSILLSTLHSHPSNFTLLPPFSPFSPPFSPLFSPFFPIGSEGLHAKGRRCRILWRGLQDHGGRGGIRQSVNNYYVKISLSFKRDFENDHSKLRILVDSRLENRRIWRFVLTLTIILARQRIFDTISSTLIFYKNF